MKNLVVVIKPVTGFWWVDEPVDVDAVVVGHQRRVVENCGQQIDGRNGGQQQENGLEDGTLVNGFAEVQTVGQR